MYARPVSLNVRNAASANGAGCTPRGNHSIIQSVRVRVAVEKFAPKTLLDLDVREAEYKLARLIVVGTDCEIACLIEQRYNVAPHDGDVGKLVFRPSGSVISVRGKT